MNDSSVARPLKPIRITDFVVSLAEMKTAEEAKPRARPRAKRIRSTGGRFRISDELWALMEPLLPEHKNTHRFGGGRPRVPDRLCADGIFFVRLEDERTHGQVSGPAAPQQQLVRALARALRLAVTEPTDPARQVYAHLRNKALLLVLDAFDDWLAALPVLTGLLRAAASVKLLVTSRERLRLPQEHVLEVSGLSLPATAADLEQAEAAELYRRIGTLGRVFIAIEREAFALPS